MCNNKDDINLTDPKSTKLDAERSKREDVEDLGHNFVTVGCTDHRYCTKCNEEDHVIKSSMIRCSEHYGDIVRPAEKIWPA